jgi:hypothetical protein
VTKVLTKTACLWIATAVWTVACVAAANGAANETPADKPAEALYLQLGQVGLDAARVYGVRDASLDRPAIHITLEDGTIAFTQDVMGRITGAFFEGDGEVLITPPNEVERKSMSLFTGMAILEERFSSAYFRFDEDVLSELRPDLRPADNKQEFVDRWKPTARNLASTDALRLLMTFSRMLPEQDGASASAEKSPTGDRFLHARLQGARLGVFDLYFDSRVGEQVEAGQEKTAENGVTYYDVWTSFATGSPSKAQHASTDGVSSDREATEDWIAVRRYNITAEVKPPTEIHARAQLQLQVKEGGSRAMVFELSRFLQVERVTLDGRPVEFIHNPAVEGTQLARRGNDIVVVILPRSTKTGQQISLEFVYGGEVLAEAGTGLLYVGARGTWYPNRGMAMADFDLQFHYPQDWTLVATGKPVPTSAPERMAGMQSSRWVSDRPIPLAGFNLGKYKVARTQAGDVSVETYAAQNVERDFPVPSQLIKPNFTDPAQPPESVIVPDVPSPAKNEVTVGEAAAKAIEYYAERFGPYPYSHLALTQLPGRESQGWPGLVFLSSYAFLQKEERQRMHYEPYRILMEQMIPAHETAHQWWGDLISWKSYRDQWFSEGLASYCALMMLQDKDPRGFREVMDKYRHDLIEKNKDDVAPIDAGPVTLGARLVSSHFPGGYEAISYGRGAWLFHMLRTMLNDTAAQEVKSAAKSKSRFGTGPDEPFVRALRKLRQKYEGKSISTSEMLDVFAEDLPPALRYEGKPSLDWFLNGWINGTALPKLELKGVKFTPKGLRTMVSGTLLQKDAPADLVTSVPVYAAIAGKPPVLLGRVFADGEESTFEVSAPAGTRKVVVDPYDTILTRSK